MCIVGVTALAVVAVRATAERLKRHSNARFNDLTVHNSMILTLPHISCHIDLRRVLFHSLAMNHYRRSFLERPISFHLMLTLAFFALSLLLVRADWPEFRGPNSDGHVPGKANGLPLHWSETNNVKWKTEI